MQTLYLFTNTESVSRYFYSLSVIFTELQIKFYFGDFGEQLL